MAKIVHIEPGQAVPLVESAGGPPKQVEVLVTPQPKTRAQRRGNVKAEHLHKEQERQGQNAPAPQKLSSWQKKARRKRKREIYRLAAKADAARGGIKQN